MLPNVLAKINKESLQALQTPPFLSASTESTSALRAFLGFPDIFERIDGLIANDVARWITVSKLFQARTV